MSEEELQALEEEEFWLKYLLDFRVKNREQSPMSKSEFEEYVDAILDRLIEIRNIKNQYNNNEGDSN